MTRCLATRRWSKPIWAATMTEPVLAIDSLQGWYDDFHVLQGVSLEVKRASASPSSGATAPARRRRCARSWGCSTSGPDQFASPAPKPSTAASETIARLGVGYVPEERGIYATLDVTENLLLPPRVAAGGMSIDDILPAVSRAARAPPQSRHAPVGRRAADAGDRPRSAHRRHAVPARRSDRGPRAGSRPADRPRHRDHEAAGPHARSRRAEFPLRRETRRPSFRHGARTDRRCVRARRGGGADSTVSKPISAFRRRTCRCRRCLGNCWSG